MATSRNIYKDDVDFSVLALQDPKFNKHLKANGQLDFSKPETVQQLTKSLLERDFGLHIELPDDRLCPPVPNRFNYILWIQDLLDSTSESYTDRYDSNREVTGLDIGTGASCIYPLLGCAQRPKWRFAATDIDEKNMHYARQNIVSNNFKSRIRPLLVKPHDPLIPLDIFSLESINFTICNPPFHSSAAELLASAAAKSRPPYSACTGAEIEMVTKGGEVAFVNRMIDESLVLKERCQWYTSMLGKFSSVGTIVEKLKEKGIKNWAVTEFVQGGKTRRWALGWSWGSMRPRMEVARGISTLPKHLLPFPSEYHFIMMGKHIEDIATYLNASLGSLDLRWQYRPNLCAGIGFALKDVWSRSARRQKKKAELAARITLTENMSEDAMDEDDDEDEPALGFKLQLTKMEDGTGVEVLIRWLRGIDSVLFESFCGMLKRQLTGI